MQVFKQTLRAAIFVLAASFMFAGASRMAYAQADEHLNPAFVAANR